MKGVSPVTPPGHSQVSGTWRHGHTVQLDRTFGGFHRSPRLA